MIVLVIFIVLIGIAAILAMWAIGIYNSLVAMRQKVRSAWAQIDVQLTRRHDLIPNLVETAKGYMQHERETLSAVTEARSRAMGAGSVGDKAAAEGQLGGALSQHEAAE